MSLTLNIRLGVNGFRNERVKRKKKTEVKTILKV